MSSSGGTPAVQTQTDAPWAPAQSYLTGLGNKVDQSGKTVLGADGKPLPAGPGVLPAAQAQFQDSSWSPEMGTNATQAAKFQQDLINNGNYKDIWETGNRALQGLSDTNISGVGAIAGPGQINAQAARGLQGGLDPSAALQKLLSGTPDNPYIAQQAQALTGLSNQNLAQNVMPNIRSGAMLSGQYGGSRQGIAEGVAAGNAQTGLNSNIADMYSNAYQQAQNNMMGTANALNSQSGEMAAQNAANTINTQQFNAGLGLQNNAQTMAQAGQNMGFRQAGAGMVGAGTGAQSNAFGNLQNIYGQPNAYNQQNLQNYADIINGNASLGGTASSTQTGGGNPMAGLLGGALGGAQLYSMLGGGGAAAGGLGALMGGGGAGVAGASAAFAPELLFGAAAF